MATMQAHGHLLSEQETAIIIPDWLLLYFLKSCGSLARFQGEHHHSTPPPTPPLKMSEPAKRPLDEDPSINVIVKSQDGRQLYFRINRSLPLQKLLIAYCKKMNLDHNTTYLFYNGDHVAAKRTPNQLGMEDGDEIDAMRFQMGGGCRGI